MKVWIINQYSYDPEPIFGAYSSQEKAQAALEANFELSTEYGPQNERWERKDDHWYVGEIVELEIE